MCCEFSLWETSSFDQYISNLWWCLYLISSSHNQVSVGFKALFDCCPLSSAPFQGLGAIPTADVTSPGSCHVWSPSLLHTDLLPQRPWAGNPGGDPSGSFWFHLCGAGGFLQSRLLLCIFTAKVFERELISTAGHS